LRLWRLAPGWCPQASFDRLAGAQEQQLQRTLQRQRQSHAAAMQDEMAAFKQGRAERLVIDSRA
jgi:hypothetical protein